MQLWVMTSTEHEPAGAPRLERGTETREYGLVTGAPNCDDDLWRTEIRSWP